jgi:hypothetical protein
MKKQQPCMTKIELFTLLIFALGFNYQESITSDCPRRSPSNNLAIHLLQANFQENQIHNGALILIPNYDEPGLNQQKKDTTN